MPLFNDAWLEHQRKRFMRPDAGRYMRRDVSRYLQLDAHRWLPRGGNSRSRKAVGRVWEFAQLSKVS